MSQFNAETLSRLLRNVERSVLVEAIEISEMWDLFGSFERGVLIEVGQILNTIANFNTFGDALLRQEDDQAYLSGWELIPGVDFLGLRHTIRGILLLSNLLTKGLTLAVDQEAAQTQANAMLEAILESTTPGGVPSEIEPAPSDAPGAEPYPSLGSDASNVREMALDANAAAFTSGVAWAGIKSCFLDRGGTEEGHEEIQLLLNKIEILTSDIREIMEEY